MASSESSSSSAVDEAIVRAHEAFASAVFVDPGVRAGWLERLGAALESRRSELVGIAHDTTHLPVARLEGELTRTIFQLQLLADVTKAGQELDIVIDHADPSWGMGPRPDLRRMEIPIGVVGVFGASNFPFAFSVLGGDTASALAAGCAVVHKIHSAHVELGLRTAEIAVEALAAGGAPDGIFSAVTGREAGTILVSHPLTSAVGFTGSTAGGRALFDLAMARPEPIPFYGELGSINPVIVLPRTWSVRRSEILAQFTQSFTMGMGQFCTKPGLLMVPERDAAPLVEELSTNLTQVTTFPMLTPGLAESFLHSRSSVAKTLGSDSFVEVGSSANPHQPAPSFVVVGAEDVLQNPRLLREEMFGPASVIVCYADMGELTDLVRLLEGQLTLSIHGEPDDETPAAVMAVAVAKSGRLLWNEWPTGVSVTYAQQHGGPYPSSTMSQATSVGTSAIRRFTRPVAYQGFPDDRLPPALSADNPLGLDRVVHPASSAEQEARSS